jgi:anti-anti-sigma regulatory factor
VGLEADMGVQAGRRGPFPGSITIEHEAGGRRVLCLSGDVDSAAVAEYERRQGGLPVVVDEIDAGSVSFLASAGLALMVRCAKAAAAATGRRPVLRAAAGAVDRVLRAAGLETYFARPGDLQGEAPPDRARS